MRRAVIDQPGLKIIVLGLLVSIFIGLTIRSQITPNKINERLRKIVQELEQKNKSKKISIDFAEARLMLSDWGFPFPHLYISNIKISSTSPECIDNQVYIESLDIPFSWINMLEAKDDQIDTVRAGLVELRLDNPDQCFSEVKAQSKTDAAVNSSVSPQSEVARAVSKSVPDNLHIYNLYIDKLKIIDKHNYNIPVSLQTVGIKIAMDKNKVQSVDLKSQLYLFRDNESSLYKFKSDFNLNYELKPDGKVASSALIHGKLIDKPFEINLTYIPESNKIILKHSIKDLSVKALMSLTSKQNIRAQSQLDGISGLSISNVGEGEYNLNNKALGFYKISNILLSSGESSISVDAITVTSVKPLKFEPFKVSMNQFDLEKIKSIPAFMSIQKSINNFGNISGTILVNSENDIEAEGSIKDLQFIFSNRGQRAYQKVDELSYKATRRTLVINRIVLEGQATTGELKLQYEPQDNHLAPKIEAQAEISNIKLNESVYNIFSFSQAKPTTISLSLSAHAHHVKSKLRFDQLASSAMEVKQLEVGYTASVGPADGRLHNSIFDLYVKNLKILRSEALDESFYGVLEQLDNTVSIDDANRPTDFYFDQLKVNYAKKDQGEVAINLSANYFSKIRNEKNNLRMLGEFTNPTRALFDIELLDHGKSIQKFSVNADLGQYSFEIKK